MDFDLSTQQIQVLDAAPKLTRKEFEDEDAYGKSTKNFPRTPRKSCARRAISG